MREMLLVAAREIDERVRTRSFVFGTLLVPVLVLGILALPALLERPTEHRIAVLDAAPAPIGDAFLASLTMDLAGAGVPGARAARAAVANYRVERVAGEGEDAEALLLQRMRREQFDAVVVLPVDVRATSRVRLHSAGAANPAVVRDIRRAATDAVQADRLARSGLRLDNVASVLAPVIVETGAEEDGTALASGDPRRIYLAYGTAMLIYLMIALYGTSVTRSVLEEKMNRIAEVLISSVRPADLMTGKILGVASAVLLQLAIWLGLLALLVGRSSWVADRFGIDPGALSVLVQQPGTTLLLVAYFILGFLLFAALFAGLGAAVTSDQEAQAYQMLFMLPLLLPVFFVWQLTTQPLQPLSRTLGLFPFTSPVAMPMRMAAAGVPAGELALSLALLAGATVLVARVAGRIYRAGLLATGQRAGARQLLRWLRSS